LPDFGHKTGCCSWERTSENTEQNWVHGNDDLPKGLMRKIIREDIQMELEDFEKLVKG
jgi:hypothetical protein